MKKLLTIALIAVFFFGVGCGKAEADESVTVKYFEWSSGPWAGCEVEITEEDIEGRPYLKAVYDENGNLLSESFFDENGDKYFGPEEYNDMIHRYEYTYDENGYEASKTTLGPDGEPVASFFPAGVYRWEYTLDEDGDLLVEKMFYIGGEVREFTHDGEGNVTERWYQVDE